MVKMADSPHILRIFLCHSSGDKQVVREIYKKLRDDDFKPWLDEYDLLPGQNWRLEIEKEVRNSDVVITCLSRSSVGKKGYVQKEIKVALEMAEEQPEGVICLIPLRLQECELPERLKDLHRVDFYKAGGYERLIEALQRRANTLNSALKQRTSNPTSIAVLPFTNLSFDPQNDFFCDELAGELINRLTKIEGLRVPPRTSAFPLKGNFDVGKIGQELDVGSVLEGQVISVGEPLRVNVELVSVSSGYSLLSAQYDRRKADIFKVLEDITLRVANVLELKLFGEEKATVLKRHTDNAEAYEIYLKGRHSFYKHTEDGWREAIGYFEQAIEKDPEYGLAYARLSSVLAFAWYFGVLPHQEAILKWEAANSQALKIGDHLEETHIAAGRFQFFYKWDWEETEREYKRAIEINPLSADGHQQYGLLLCSRGHLEQAVEEADLAIKIEPHSLLVNYHVGWIYWFAGRFDAALEIVWQMIRIEPNFYGSYAQRGTIFLVMEKYEEAVEECLKAIKLNFDQLVLGILGYACGMAGQRDEALNILNQLLDARNYHSANEINIARTYAGLGEYDRAFEWLEKAYQKRNGNLVYLKSQTEVGAGIWGKRMRTDPRFPELLRRIGITS